jgi:hypothetical protein
LLLAGNYHPDYKDASGSVSRRMAIFKYDQVPAYLDTEMPSKIKLEAPSVFLRLIKAYRTMTDAPANRGRSFYTRGRSKGLACKLLQESSFEFEAESNKSVDFVRNGSSSVVFEEVDKSVYTKVSAIAEQFRAVYPNETFDKCALEAAGYKIVKPNVCRHPGCSAVPSTKKTCRGHYSAMSRKTGPPHVRGLKMVRVPARVLP